jgi:hypothetical protein
VWKCEFCNTENNVCFEEEELPKHSEINYLLEAPAQVLDKKMGKETSEDISVIFRCA